METSSDIHCSVCKKYVEKKDHECFIQHVDDAMLKNKIKGRKSTFLFYDFETVQIEVNFVFFDYDV